MPSRGVTKVERLNRSPRQETDGRVSRFVTTPDWGRRAPLTSPELEPELKNPRLEARRKAKEAKVKEEVQETVIAPTLGAGQPRMRGVNGLLTVLAIIGCIHVMVMMGIELNRMVASQQEITRLTAETQVLEQEVAGLQSVLDNGNNPAFREQLARRAGFAYPEEARWLSVPAQSETTNQP
jgi:cell division protein FtsB